eukprot:SAG31_NODE_2694_length_5235_cov_3.558995_1_plen_55_part_10
MQELLNILVRAPARPACHGMHASVGAGARRSGGSRDTGTERGPKELDTSTAARLP